MRRYIAILFLALLFFSSGYAEEELQTRSIKSETENNLESDIPLAELSGEPSAFVNESVNVISGQYHETQTDAVVCGGPEPLTFQRSYVSSYFLPGGLCNGWNINNFGQIVFTKANQKKEKYCTLVWDHGGGYSRYEGECSSSKSAPSILTISSKDLKKGFTNSSSSQLSGATNVKNNRLTYTEKTGQLVFSLGNGTKRNYKLRKNTVNELDLCREVRPNGNQIFYEYGENKYDYRISKVRLANKQGTYLSTLSVNYISEDQTDLNPAMEGFSGLHTRALFLGKK